MATKAKRTQATKTKKKEASKAKSKLNRPPVSEPKPQSLMDRLPKNEIEYLEMMIRMDERNIDGSGSGLDLLFTAQRERSLAKIAALKAAK